LQQPEWSETDLLQRVTSDLAARPPIVRAKDVGALRSVLADVAAGRTHVVQAGDCAEDPAESTPCDVARKAGLLDVLAGALKTITRTSVVHVGRIGGQFAKPRSKPTEWVGDVELPVYRGHLVNSPEPDRVRRQPDPTRLLSGYDAACRVADNLGWRDGLERSFLDAPLWTSHEVLLLDFEIPMLRRQADGRPLLTSTHWPWIGNRTRQLDGAHVALLAAIANPVACKIGPDTPVDELVALCARLDPDREPGRLTLIARIGADAAADQLPLLVSAVHAEGHPVIWLADPMHGNTVAGPEGLKTRYVETMRREVRDFHDAVTANGGMAGGLHLETTPEDVTECVENEAHLDQVTDRYTTLCDPRLNPSQAMSVISAWRG
jgi:3-deoxy-7-phosphoheptulonate synthase